MKPGAHYDVPSDVYHEWPYASSTAIRALMRTSPAHAKVGLLDSDSPSLRLGTAVHAAILEPTRFEGLIRVEPKCDKRTKDGKALFESFEQSLMPGQTRISEEQFAVVRGIERSVRASRTCTQLLERAAVREMSVVAEVEGVMCKCRCDAFGDGLVLDLKTTSGLACEEEFAKSVWNYGYAIQAAFYRLVMDRAGIPMTSFAWIACETNEPFGVACYRIDASVLDHFEPAIEQALHRWADCEHTQSWPAYPDELRPLTLPAWMTRQLEGT